MFFLYTTDTGNPDWFNNSLPDGGPVYAETDFDRWIVEPWNALTSIFMMLPAFYWYVKSARSKEKNFFFLYCLALVFLGGLGSTLFHAFRYSRVFLMLDIIPSAILTLSLSIWFWLKSFRQKWTLAVFIAVVLLVRLSMFRYLPQHRAINFSYFLAGITILLPLSIYLFRSRFAGLMDVLLTVLLFALALLFRETDTIRMNRLPVGTHFLWHLFSAAGSFFMMKYLYHTVNRLYKPESKS